MLTIVTGGRVYPAVARVCSECSRVRIQRACDANLKRTELCRSCCGRLSHRTKKTVRAMPAAGER
jgi:hypothetical protein